tara:strand:+ start:399 stop:1727 length:1329 start_codon:yes stop_codon:yes gene_type:complete
MSQTILIEPNENLRKLFSINLSTYAATDVVPRENANDAVALLSILPSINLIVTKAQVDGEQTAIKIYNFLKDNNLQIPMIIMGECRELAPDVLTLKEPISWDVLVKHAADILGVKEEEVKKNAQPAFAALESHFFYDIEHTPCDVYIQIKKADNSYQFVKRLRAQDSFTKEDIEKYESQGLRYFHIPKDFEHYFVTFVTNNLIRKMEEDDVEFGLRLSLNANAYQVVRDHIAKVGLDESMNTLADTCIRSMVLTIKEAPTLASLLKQLFSNKISYAYQHAHLLCVIGHFILLRQKWYEPKHLDIFTLVSFFSDITLNSSEQIQINSISELKASKLSNEQRQVVLNHANDAAELIKDYPNYNKTIEDIIRQHHGSKKGFGFPEEPDEEIHTLSKIFIIADSFVKIMLAPHTPKNKKEILAILYAQFPGQSFQDIIGILEEKIA